MKRVGVVGVYMAGMRCIERKQRLEARDRRQEAKGQEAGEKSSNGAA
jgi:hypothetical protein